MFSSPHKLLCLDFKMNSTYTIYFSYLGFYDVQSSLSSDTLLSVAIAMSVAVFVLLAATLNVGLSVAAVLTVSGVIFASVAALVVLGGWRLNVLESVAITLAIGLSVDFTLHYAVVYRHAEGKDVAAKVGERGDGLRRNRARGKEE